MAGGTEKAGRNIPGSFKAKPRYSIRTAQRLRRASASTGRTRCWKPCNSYAHGFCPSGAESGTPADSGYRSRRVDEQRRVDDRRPRLQEDGSERVHRNLGKLWMAVRRKLSAIGSGYALSDDGLWRQHSWGLMAGLSRPQGVELS